MAAAGGEGFFRLWGNIFRGGLPPDRLAAATANAVNVQAGALVGILFAGLLVAVLEASWRRKLPAEAVAGALALIVFASDYRTDSDFVKTVRLEDYVRRDEAIRTMQADPSLFRAVSFLPNYRENTLSAFGIEGARGFFDNRIRWYDELIAGNNLQSLGLMSLLNIKYLLMPPPGIDHPLLEEVVRERDRILYRNRSVLPRAFVARRWEVMSDRQAMLRRLTDDKTDLRSTIFLEKDPGLAPPPDSAAATPPKPVTWIEKGPNRYALRAETGENAILFVSNPYLPYWKAFLDGKEVELLRADYALQAVALPPGEHEVSLEYRSAPYEKARAVTLAAVAFLVIGGSFARLRGARSKGEDSA
jgi:hypothetical protein